MGGSDSTGDGGLLFPIGNTLLSFRKSHALWAIYEYLSCEVCSTSIRGLDNDWCLGIAGSFQSSYNGRRPGDILQKSDIAHGHKRISSTKAYDSWNSEIVLLAVVEKLEDIIANDDTCQY